MATRYQECHKRVIRYLARLVLRQHGCQQVPLHMMHPQTGHAEARGNRPAQRGTHHQGANETGPRGIGHAINIAPDYAAL